LGQRFVRDEQGVVIVLVVLLFPVFMMLFMALFDIHRATVYRNQLQTYADVLALAGAHALDGKDDAITRADANMAAMVNSAILYSVTGAETVHNFDRANAPAEIMQVTYLTDIPGVGMPDTTFLEDHGTSAGADALFAHVVLTIPEYPSFTLGLLPDSFMPIRSIRSEALARFDGWTDDPPLGPCDFGLFAGSQVIGKNNTNFSGTMTIMGPDGISMGKPVVAPESVYIVSSDPANLDGISGGTYIPEDELPCELNGQELSLAKRGEWNNVLTTATSPYPGWNVVTLAASVTELTDVVSNTIYIAAGDITLDLPDVQHDVAVVSPGLVSLRDHSYALGMSIYAQGGIDVGNGAFLGETDLMSEAYINVGNQVDLFDATSCNDSLFGIEIYAVGNVEFINGYRMCGVFLVANDLVFKNTSNSDDYDIRAVHLETVVNIEFKNNMEFAGGEVALDLEAGTRPFTMDESLVEITPFSTLIP
jgi:hypothetical protein